MKIFLLSLSTVLLFLACSRDDFSEISYRSKIVVEGYIEQGGVAQVLLMQSVPLTVTVDSTNFLNYVIRSAMVVVSCGDQHDTLRLKTSSDHLPPFIYVGQKIIGEEGKSYRVAVMYENTLLTAESVIPPSVPIKEVNYHKESPTDTVGWLTVRFTDPADRQNYYQVATQVDTSDDLYTPALYGNLNNRDFSSPDVDFNIARGVTIFPKTNLNPYFFDGDLVNVKLRTMTKEGYDFWNSWQNEIINAQNPLFPANSSLKGNIQGNGLGIWCGYGQSVYQIQL